jgi:hypothetical protein
MLNVCSIGMRRVLIDSLVDIAEMEAIVFAATKNIGTKFDGKVEFERAFMYIGTSKQSESESPLGSFVVARHDNGYRRLPYPETIVE